MKMSKAIYQIMFKYISWNFEIKLLTLKRYLKVTSDKSGLAKSKKVHKIDGATSGQNNSLR